MNPQPEPKLEQAKQTAAARERQVKLARELYSTLATSEPLRVSGRDEHGFAIK